MYVYVFTKKYNNINTIYVIYIITKMENNFLEKIKKRIRLDTKKLWLPDKRIEFNKVNTHSWFKLNKYNHQNADTSKIPKTGIGPYKEYCGKCVNCHYNKTSKKLRKCKPIMENTYSCMKIKLKLSFKQRFIVNKWFQVYTLMYNLVIDHINKYASRIRKKMVKYKNINEIKYQEYMTKDRNIKSYYSMWTLFKEEKESLIEKSYELSKRESRKIDFEYSEKYKIPTHIIDRAIKTACSNYKAALTNMKRGNIKDFRLRRLKQNRKNKIMIIEKLCFGKTSMCPTSLNITEGRFSNGKYFDSRKIKFADLRDHLREGIFKYDSRLNEYTLYASVKTDQEKVENEHEFIAIDPGLRTFGTGISENMVLEFGTNVMEMIDRYYEEKNKVISKRYINRKEKRTLIRLKRKLDNRIDDMHWKIIKYITDRFKNVIIGNMSTKQIIKRGSKLYRKYKKKIPHIKLYKFRERLEWKCKEKRINYKMTSEYYTSKICTRCTEINDMEDSKKYKCAECGLKIDRDINAARNIYLKRNI